MSTAAKLLARKEALLERLESDPGANEREEIERLLADRDRAERARGRKCRRAERGIGWNTDRPRQPCCRGRSRSQTVQMLSPSNPQVRASFHRTYPWVALRSRRRICGRKMLERSPECLGVRGSATVTAPERERRSL